MRRSIVKITLLIISLIVLLLSFAWIITEKEVHPSEYLNINTIKDGDHIIMGDKMVDDYDGYPLWRVLTVDKK